MARSYGKITTQVCEESVLKLSLWKMIRFEISMVKTWPSRDIEFMQNRLFSPFRKWHIHLVFYLFLRLSTWMFGRRSGWSWTRVDVKGKCSRVVRKNQSLITGKVFESSGGRRSFCRKTNRVNRKIGQESRRKQTRRSLSLARVCRGYWRGCEYTLAIVCGTKWCKL